MRYVLKKNISKTGSNYFIKIKKACINCSKLPLIFFFKPRLLPSPNFLFFLLKFTFCLNILKLFFFANKYIAKSIEKSLE